MTDLNITPTLELNETISNPEEPAEVLGFHGRDTKIGLDAVVMKEEAIEANEVRVPEDAAEKIVNQSAELVVLNEDTVSVMGPSAFEKESRPYTSLVDGETTKMSEVNLTHDSFSEYDRDDVEVGN